MATNREIPMETDPSEEQLVDQISSQLDRLRIFNPTVSLRNQWRIVTLEMRSRRSTQENLPQAQNQPQMATPQPDPTPMDQSAPLMESLPPSFWQYRESVEEK